MAIFATVVIISMVQFLDPTTGRRGRGRSIFSRGSSEYGSINGRSISAEEYAQMKREARLRFFVNSGGHWPEEDDATRQMFDADRQTLEWIFFVEKANDLKIQVSDDAVNDWIADLFRDRNTGAFRVETYQRFVREQLNPHGYSEPDFLRFARHQIGYQHLSLLAGLSGSLVTPREAIALYHEENEQLSAEAALFSASNYLAGVAVTPAAVAQYYTNNMAQYRVAERVQVSYTKFDTTNYLAEADQRLAQVTNLTQQLESFYRQRGPDFFKDADGKALSHDAAIQKLKEDERQRLARDSANRKAFEFLEKLYDQYQKQPNQTDHLEKLAAASGQQSAVTEPFDRNGPQGLKVLEPFTEAALALTPQQPIPSDPLPGEDAFFVIALKKKFPSEVQPFEAVRERVTEDFRRHEATEAARRAGEAFYSRLTNGLAQNKTFQAVCLEADVNPQKLPPFSLATRSLPAEWENRVNLTSLKKEAFGLEPGKTSRFVPTLDGGYVLHLVARQPVDEAKVKAELPAFVDRLRDERRREASGQWLTKEYSLAHVTGQLLSKKGNPENPE